MVRGIGRLLFVNSIAMELASMRTHEDMVIVGPGPRPQIPVETDQIYERAIPSPPRRRPPEEPFALRHDLAPGECRFRPTGNKRSRRRRKG